MKNIAFLVELQNRRGRLAAFAQAILQLAFRGVESASAVHQPDMIVVIDPGADHHAHDPMIGQRLRPEGIDFEFWRHVACGKRRAGNEEVPNRERAQRHGEDGANQGIAGTENILHVSPIWRRSGLSTFFPLPFMY